MIVRFVKASSVPESEENLLQSTFSSIKCQKSDGELVIGAKTKAYLKEISLHEDKLKMFFADVRLFYTKTFDYIVKKWPVQENKLKLLMCSGEETKAFHLLNIWLINFPKADKIWFKISKTTDASGIKKYHSLSKLITTVLVIPKSNSPTGRVFSLARKNKTEFRANTNTALIKFSVNPENVDDFKEKILLSNTFTKQQTASCKKSN
ncbi:hypothetical protein PR048_030358 [Dryococelus australis]|uniref:Uncharacterized protein n=1 Tax=Dryococelus australis TaxID=614101 RepID=A0ABQ9G9J0_9NEOP|nr:hypothetical protein PR048_030358 [Dryococelus australis]